MKDPKKSSSAQDAGGLAGNVTGEGGAELKSTGQRMGPGQSPAGGPPNVHGKGAQIPAANQSYGGFGTPKGALDNVTPDPHKGAVGGGQGERIPAAMQAEGQFGADSVNKLKGGMPKGGKGVQIPDQEGKGAFGNP